MHPQLFLLALVAPLALSLPQPITPGESGALIARQESGNSTDHRYHGGKHPGPPKGHHPERALKEGKGAGNSTGEGHSRLHEHHEGPPHKERDLIERQDSSNSTGGPGKEGPHHPDKHHGPPHHERDLIERQDSSNSTGGPGKDGPHSKPKMHHGPGHIERDLTERQHSGNSTGGDDKPHHHKPGHPGPKVDKRIEEANGTTAGHVGKGEKFTPDDGYHGGPQRPGAHKRSFIDVILNRI